MAYYASSSKLFMNLKFETEAEAQRQVDEWNEQDETAYMDDNGNWQRMSGCESVAIVMSQEEWDDILECNEISEKEMLD